MDHTDKMYALLQDILTTVAYKIKIAPTADRAELFPEMIKVQTSLTAYQAKILQDRTLTTEKDMNDLASIKSEIDSAADKQKLFNALGRTISFVVTRRA
ncbi:hypothetical protein [Muriicola sp. Z0-33]|uniref:hypothetical protein n=1 Tax=Muriicola sp. Z0-33 TaxID=2816957 RepID=UPI0022374329|nr:hypothetical protein [Muriicola sp. Z0-33]MCW5514762.1 hypothetical protein [Muriicola sp. Z0-33]